jgi:ABC-2 type transport system permease protein
MFNIILKEIREFFREKTNLFFFLMFPVVLIFLLGNLLQSEDKAEDMIGEIKILYQVQTEDQFQVNAIEQFIKAAGENQNLTFERTQDLQAAKELAGKDAITAAVVFTGNPLTINIYEGTDRIKNRTVGAIMNGFAQTDRSIISVIKTNPASLSAAGGNDEDYVEQKDLGVNRSMLDYYAVSMVAMICFMSAIQGSVAFLSERENKTINRLFLAPQNRVSIFLQKILGMVPKVILQISILMIISVLVFNAHYAATPADNLYLFLMFFVVTLAMVSIGVVLGLFIKTSPMIIVMPPLWIMMFFGGTYSKELYIKGLTEKMPIYQIQQAAFDLTVFGRSQKATSAIIICLIILIIMLAVGAFIFSRMEEER